MMWEVIHRNRRISLFLFAGMAVVLVVLGFLIGNVFDPEYGGIFGIGVAVVIWMGLTLLSLAAGGDVLLRTAGAREVAKDVHPRLFNVVEEMKIAAGLPAMPRVYIIDEPAPNAFAVGLKPEKSAIAVTAGLLSRLNRDELQGVVAHEMAHVLNRDSQLMTVAGIMLGSIVLLSRAFLRHFFYFPSSSRRYRKSGGGSPQLQLIMIGVAILFAVLAPIFARLLYLAVSRKREYLADATAVQLTRYPEGLASALEKISADRTPLEAANQVTAPMFIAAPFVKSGSKLTALTSTHPPIEERVKILRFMSRGANYYHYQRAFSRARGKPSALIPRSNLDKKNRIEIRPPSVEAEPAKDVATGKRELGDLMRAVNDYAFLACVCGLKMKIPPDLPAKEITCPKCQRKNHVPKAQLATLAALAGVVAGGPDTATAGPAAESAGGARHLQYRRTGEGWESFNCACGKLLQLSPAFRASQIACRACGRVTHILAKHQTARV